MFKDIRVRAALRTLGLFGVAMVAGLITALALQTFGMMAVMTMGMCVMAAYAAVMVYDIMLMKLQHEKAHEELAASLEKSTTE
jgi:cephalosporin-C deacetylase-like acetyl esterase